MKIYLIRRRLSLLLHPFLLLSSPYLLTSNLNPCPLALPRKTFVTPRSDRPNMYIMCGTVSWILMCGLSMLLWWLLFLVYCCLIYYLRAMFIYSLLFVVNKWLLSLSLSFFLVYHRYGPPWQESSGLIFNLMFFHWFCLIDSTGICWIQH